MKIDLNDNGARATGEKPRIVCLCGSSRFSEAFQQANLSETLAGRIVLTIGCDRHSDGTLKISPENKVRLDELHKRKIDLADESLVLNVGGYIGESTRSEIDYAKAHGKPIRWLEPETHAQRAVRYW
ncbi:MAG: hypothetical protein ACYDDA_09485 [Acidiferrobacteraceae bacterium]